MNRAGFSLLVLVFLFARVSHAGIYLEPYLGFHKGNIKAKFEIQGLGEGETNNSMDGLLYGAKVGMSFTALVFGIDYMGGSVSENSQPEENMTTTNIGAFAQFSVPMIKFALTYFPMSYNASDHGTFKGEGFKMGAGYTGFPIVAINLDFMMFTYDSAEKADPLVYNYFSGKANTTLLSVSAPFDF